MTINKAYLGTLRATVTLTYIPVLTPGLYDTFPGSPETFPGHIGSFPGRFWMKILIFYHILVRRYSESVETFFMSRYMFPGS